VIARFLERAWRQPVTEKVIDRFHKFFGKVRPEMPSFEDAIKESLAMALVSPSFLYILEPDSASARKLNPYELASRLSYFLWSTMPDADLLDAARAGRLDRRDGLKEQVNRMIADSRCDRFIDQFTTQWLDLEAGDRLVIDKDDKPTVTPIKGAVTAADIVKGGWNELHIIVKDNNFKMFLNGKPASEFTEHLPDAKRLHMGMVQLQLHDPGMIVHFKEILLKVLK
jgi:hypothetical protein